MHLATVSFLMQTARAYRTAETDFSPPVIQIFIFKFILQELLINVTDLPDS